MKWGTASNPLEVENSSRTEKSKTSEGTTKINQTIVQLLPRLQKSQKKDLFLYRISRYLQTIIYCSDHAQAKPKQSNSIKVAQPLLQIGCSETQTNQVNPTEAG